MRVSVAGELDQAASQELGALLLHLVRNHPTTLVVDLVWVSFCGAAGLRVLGRSHREMTARGGKVVVHCAGQGLVTRLLLMDGLLDGLTVVTGPST